MYNTIFEVQIPDCNMCVVNLSVDLKCLKCLKSGFNQLNNFENDFADIFD